MIRDFSTALFKVLQTGCIFQVVLAVPPRVHGPLPHVCSVRRLTGFNVAGLIHQIIPVFLVLLARSGLGEEMTRREIRGKANEPVSWCSWGRSPVAAGNLSKERRIGHIPWNVFRIPSYTAYDLLEDLKFLHSGSWHFWYQTSSFRSTIILQKVRKQSRNTDLKKKNKKTTHIIKKGKLQDVKTTYIILLLLWNLCTFLHQRYFTMSYTRSCSAAK